MVTHLSTMRMTLATKASRWKMYFYGRSVLERNLGDIDFAYSAHLDAMFVEGRPLDDFSLESVVNLWYQLEGQSLSRSAWARAWRQVKRSTFRIVLAGMQ